ncbi:MAG: tRNA (adenosine(37)-N6)-threonylcarbamoyltransferase complex ATPase subunit type 1 TsaE [Candidatus Doudnabacteria bacterium]|nr:tRNA (adenosine(37)-N6)-threonylcarbamoyltransferase complex ATPase subunit type 1 TsaE [Candidatus Doudnabacteria bacterium]
MVQKLPRLSLSEFKRLAARLAKKYAHSGAVIGLIGPLGAGKTTFVKNFARGLGVKKIKSPTFTIIDSHSAGKRQLHHIDLYRLDKSSDLEPLGIIPTLKQKSDFVIIEWVDKFPSLKKYCELIIKISFASQPGSRNVTLYKN